MAKKKVSSKKTISKKATKKKTATRKKITKEKKLSPAEELEALLKAEKELNKFISDLALSTVIGGDEDGNILDLKKEAAQIIVASSKLTFINQRKVELASIISKGKK